MMNTTGVVCPGCQAGDFAMPHICQISNPWRQSTVWNGPICHVCGQGYLGRHECDLVTTPCPDDRPGCTAAHYAHRKQEARPVTVLTIAIDPELAVEDRLRLKDLAADAFRRATTTTDEIGVDVVPAAG